MSGLRRPQPNNCSISTEIDSVRGSIYDAFASSAQNHAGNLAVITPERAFTYAELALAAGQVHALLASAGPKSGRGVGLMLGEPFHQIAAILGVLRAGMLYVFLDPDFPENRLRQAVTDGVVEIILTDGEHANFARSLTPAGFPVVIACFRVTDPIESPPPVSLDQPELAYVAYTSGSTGVPKGVMHSHGNVLHEAAVHRATLDLRPDDRASLLYSPGVTGAVRDLFPTLFAGGAICPFPFKERGIGQLKSWLHTQRVTRLHAVPTLFRNLMQAMEPDERLEQVRTVFVAGERVTPDDLALFRRHFSPTARFYTGIGATETSSIYTHWFVDEDGPWANNRLPSGWPVPDKEVHLVGEDRQPVATGESGEIAVCSAFLSPGYWGQPALTASVFSETEDGSGRRIYYTGDYGCFDSAGRLVHLGRRDQQIKINGHRIELGEIEHALCAKPGITAALARADHANPTRPRIVAYVIAPPAGFDEPELRRHLSQKLPSVAMPAVIVRLDKFPLTSNGKINYQALPPPRSALSEAAKDGAVESWTAAQRRVLDVWREIFPDLPEYLPDDSFEYLGGDSMEALRLAELLKRRLGLELAGGILGRGQTIVTLAAQLEESARSIPIADAIEREINQLMVLAKSWRFQEFGQELAPNCPVFLAGAERPGMPLVWFGEPSSGLSIGLAVAERRPVYLIPSAAAANAEVMDQVCRRLAGRLLPHLTSPVACGGCCYSGLQAMLLARATRDGGHEVSTLFLVDVFGSRTSRRILMNLFCRIEKLRCRLRDDPIGSVARTYVSKIKSKLLRRRNRRGTGGDATMPLAEPYFVDFEPFGYDGPMVHILSSPASWMRRVSPRLGWTSIESGHAEIHDVPGGHEDLWHPPALFQVTTIIENGAARLDQTRAGGPRTRSPFVHEFAATGESPCAEPVVLENISDTALWAAVYRAWESRRPDARFHDPLAERLVGEHGEGIVRKLGAGWMAGSFVVRTVAIDDFVLRAVAEGVDTVVNLAAGLDTRPYRLDLPPSLHWIEVDLPFITAYKNAKLAAETPRCRLTRLVQDLRDGGGRSALFDKIADGVGKGLIITEGLLIYLPEADVAALANDLAARRGFSLWIQDFVTPEILAALKKNWGKILDQAKSPMVFAPSNGAEFFRAHGWIPREIRNFHDEAQRLQLDQRLPSGPTDSVLSENRATVAVGPGYALLQRSTLP